MARHLCGAADKPPDEAFQRAAISRAYFAAFCHARNHAMAKHGFMSQRYDDHMGIRSHYMAKNLPKVANYLDDLRKSRNNCDYENDVANLKAQAQQMIGKADYVIKTLG